MMRLRPYGVLAGLMVGLMFLCSSAVRAETSLTSCLAQSPFYQKLLEAGVFNIPVTAPDSGKAEPMQILFLKARMIHYSWDQYDLERWQSADETSRAFRGSCADKAIWLYTHMCRNGYQKVSLVIGRYSPTSRVLHMWVTYEDPAGGTLLLDPTIQKKPWKVDAFPERLYKRLVRIDGADCIAL